MADSELRVCALYPELMNIYADRGNLLLLEQRCRWRGLGFSVQATSLEDALDPEGADLYYIGGGQDRDQKLCAADLAGPKRGHRARGRRSAARPRPKGSRQRWAQRLRGGT